MKIYLSSDHAGLDLKRFVIDLLQETTHDVEDLGPFSEESVDYPDFADTLAAKMEVDPDACGIIMCGTGIGISIRANRYKFIRAALCHTPTDARLTRQHNDANVLALGSRTTGTEVIRDIVQTFLETDFEGGRHQRRVDKLGQ